MCREGLLFLFSLRLSLFHVPSRPHGGSKISNTGGAPRPLFQLFQVWNTSLSTDGTLGPLSRSVSPVRLGQFFGSFSSLLLRRGEERGEKWRKDRRGEGLWNQGSGDYERRKKGGEKWWNLRRRGDPGLKENNNECGLKILWGRGREREKEQGKKSFERRRKGLGRDGRVESGAEHFSVSSNFSSSSSSFGLGPFSRAGQICVDDIRWTGYVRYFHSYIGMHAWVEECCFLLKVFHQHISNVIFWNFKD